MEPKKVKRAITITVVVALILILLCLCLLFDWIKIPPKSTEQPEEPTVSEEPQPPSEEPEPQTEPPAEPAPEKTPGPEDLSGCSDKLYHPKSESYLKSYESMVVRPSTGDTVYLQYKPEKIQYTTDAIMKLKANTVVTALAKENGYTLVLVQEGVAGWIRTFELDLH